ncbi:ribonuclease E inhibitor RraB [Chitinibacter sp. SCUT-21]|uniref:ribonuclease E inhibitor RraB n=1 Tax=Chitinibacter sp. SCUT-21 TaxID=2970891 RepID=UPI0035A72568
MITLDQLEEMFASIRDNTDWDLSAPLLWGYFFTADQDEQLTDVLPLLEAQGYTFVDLFIPQLDAGEQEYFVLHVEKAEVHTTASLFVRNGELAEFAAQHDLRSYDGMDVGPLA